MSEQWTWNAFLTLGLYPNSKLFTYRNVSVDETCIATVGHNIRCANRPSTDDHNMAAYKLNDLSQNQKGCPWTNKNLEDIAECMLCPTHQLSQYHIKDDLVRRWAAVIASDCPRLWDPTVTFGLDLGIQYSCIGQAVTRGRSCHNIIVSTDWNRAMLRLGSLASVQPLSLQVQVSLREIATLLLCNRWHGNPSRSQQQISHVVAQWTRQLRSAETVVNMNKDHYFDLCLRSCTRGMDQMLQSAQSGIARATSAQDIPQQGATAVRPSTPVQQTAEIPSLTGLPTPPSSEPRMTYEDRVLADLPTPPSSEPRERIRIPVTEFDFSDHSPTRRFDFKGGASQVSVGQKISMNLSRGAVEDAAEDLEHDVDSGPQPSSQISQMTAAEVPEEHDEIEKLAQDEMSATGSSLSSAESSPSVDDDPFRCEDGSQDHSRALTIPTSSFTFRAPSPLKIREPKLTSSGLRTPPSDRAAILCREMEASNELRAVPSVEPFGTASRPGTPLMKSVTRVATPSVRSSRSENQSASYTDSIVRSESRPCVFQSASDLSDVAGKETPPSDPEVTRLLATEGTRPREIGSSNQLGIDDTQPIDLYVTSHLEIDDAKPHDQHSSRAEDEALTADYGHQASIPPHLTLATHRTSLHESNESYGHADVLVSMPPQIFGPPALRSLPNHRIDTAFIVDGLDSTTDLTNVECLTLRGPPGVRSPPQTASGNVQQSPALCKPRRGRGFRVLQRAVDCARRRVSSYVSGSRGQMVVEKAP